MLFFSLKYKENEWVERIPRRREFWAQSGVKFSILGNKSFSEIFTIDILL